MTIGRLMFLVLFMGGVLWMLLHKEATEEASQDKAKFDAELQKTQDTIEAQQKLLQERVNEHKEALPDRDKQLEDATAH